MASAARRAPRCRNSRANSTEIRSSFRKKSKGSTWTTNSGPAVFCRAHFGGARHERVGPLVERGVSGIRPFSQPLHLPLIHDVEPRGGEDRLDLLAGQVVEPLHQLILC